MPKIYHLQFGLDIALAIKMQNASKHIAVLMKHVPGKAPMIVGVGAHPESLDDWSTHTAIVNAIQGLDQDTNLGKLRVFSTYRPTAACLGMMRTHELDSVTCPDGYIQVRRNPWTSLTLGPRPKEEDFYVADNLSDGTLFAKMETLAASTNRTTIDRTVEWKASWEKFKNKLSPPRRIAEFQRYPGNGGGYSQDFVDAVYMLFVYTIAGRVWNEGSGLTVRGSRIVAVLGNPQGTIYGWQVNARKIRTTFHAETNLIQGIGKIPDDATLYTTLEPCHQCAGLYVRATGKRCIFGQHDDNMTENTALGSDATWFSKPTFQTKPHIDAVPAGTRMASLREGEKKLRVLDTLASEGALEVYAQSERVLRALIAINRERSISTPKRLFMENFAAALRI